MATVIKDLKDALKSQEPVIQQILAKDFREDLNKNIHILDLSYSTLLSSTYSRIVSSLSKKEAELYNTVHSRLVKVLTRVRAGRTVSSISDPEFKTYFASIKTKGPVLIFNGPDHIFLVGSQFGSLQTYYSKNIASDPELKSTRFGISTTYKDEVDSKGRIIPNSYIKQTRIKVDFGHLPTEGDSNLTSPLVKKFEAVISNTSDPTIKASAEAALRDLYDVQVKLVHRFKNTTPEAIDTSRDILGSGYVVVTLQNQKLNNKFSAEEGRIYFKLLKSIVSKINYTNLSGSNTIKQDIVENIANIFRKDKPKKLRKHNEHTAILDIKIPSKPYVTTSKSNLIKSIPEEDRVIIPTFNLQSYIAARLADQIKHNMGTGYDKKVLNYRSGRLADSASIERVSQSRAGMVSVFYNYMRNPYGTFSTGGAQQNPSSRDPKLLISKSIREIGASIVGNRMRAILV